MGADASHAHHAERRFARPRAHGGARRDRGLRAARPPMVARLRRSGARRAGRPGRPGQPEPARGAGAARPGARPTSARPRGRRPAAERRGRRCSRQRFPANGIYPPPLGGAIFNIGDAQLNVSWELDFFGRNRSALDAAIGSASARPRPTPMRRACMLAEQRGNGYVQLGLPVERLRRRRSARSSSATRSSSSSASGSPPASTPPSSCARARARCPRRASRSRRSTSRSRSPATRWLRWPRSRRDACDTLSPRLATVQAVPVPANVPADLLGRRADIAAARWRVEAANQRRRRTRKGAVLSEHQSDGVRRLHSIGFNKLLKAGSEQWGVGPAIRLPIFDAGRLRANLRGSGRPRRRGRKLQQHRVDAMHDVADQISSIRSVARQQRQQARRRRRPKRPTTSATQRYRAGLGTYLTVLNAEANVLTQRRLAADLRARALEVADRAGPRARRRLCRRPPIR